MEITDTVKSTSITLNISFYVIIAFVLLRPITFVFAKYELFGLNVLEYFSIIFSYFLIVPILANIRKIKLDKINFLIVIFCAYVLLSFLWGSEIAKIARVVLPFVFLFYSRIFLISQKRINALLVAAIIGYIYPILGSFYSIIMGIGREKLVYTAEFTKYGGLFLAIHPFAHAMLIFIFLYILFLNEVKISNAVIKYGMGLIAIISIYCIFRSHVRTVFLGSIFFFSIYFFKTNKKYFYIFACIVSIYIIFNLPQVENVFWQTPIEQERSFDKASTGRITTWEHNLKAFSEYSIEQKIGGIGLGGEGEKVIKGKILVEPSHNDYLTLLMTIGPVGLFLYLIIYLVLLIDVYFSKIDKVRKIWFISFLISVCVMNFVSNAYISRVELSQYFWIIMGIFYNMDQMHNSENSADEL